MIFPKEYLAEQVSQEARNIRYKDFPFQTYFDDIKDYSPMELIIMNYLSFFDLKSKEMKSLSMQARKEIADNCFNDLESSMYPNSGKIEQCIRNINHQYLGKQMNQRELYFGNIKQHFQDTVDQLPSHNQFKGTADAMDRYLWDAFKSKYYLKEKF